MPRDSGGNYSLPAGNPVTAGTTIEASWANDTMPDLGAEITNSLDRAGRGAMTDQLKAFAGSTAAPGYSFALELGSGWYRNGAADIRFSLGGTDAVMFTSGVLTAFSRLRLERALPSVDWYETDGASDEKLWVWQMESGDLILRTRDDAGSNGSAAASFVRGTGTAITHLLLSTPLRLTQIEVGHDSDTTITRDAAGSIAVEGNKVHHAGNMPLASGTYTPTITEVLNGTSLTTTPDVFNYIRVGTMVFVTGTIAVTITDEDDTTIRLDLPVASNFSATNQASGTACLYRGSLTTIGDEALFSGIVEADAAGDGVEVTFRTTATSVSCVLGLAFMYRVI